MPDAFTILSLELTLKVGRDPISPGNHILINVVLDIHASDDEGHRPNCTGDEEINSATVFPLAHVKVNILEAEDLPEAGKANTVIGADN